MGSAPRWKNAIANALSEHSKSVVLQLATMETGSPIPHVRSHIFRSWLSSSKDDSLPLILTTTDTRSPKVEQIISNPHVEIAWWIEGKQEQFRISGLASVIPEPNHQHYKHFERVINKNASSSSGLRKLVGATGKDFDWEKKRVDVYKTMSAHMRASWCRPVPGTPLIDAEVEAKDWPVRVDEPGHEKVEDGQELTEAEKARNEKNWNEALGNFSLVIIDPTEVDYVELGVIPNRRTKFWRNDHGQWEENSVVP